VSDTTIDEYQKTTRETAVYPDENAIEYLALGLNDESGEVAGAVKKHIRGDYDEDELHDRVTSEAGDVLWYWVRLLDELDVDASECLEKNQAKVVARLADDKIRGDGDNR
jgi:NTP pyrophosphatase (non-canonical NTP hydrolase)